MYIIKDKLGIFEDDVFWSRDNCIKALILCGCDEDETQLTDSGEFKDFEIIEVGISPVICREEVNQWRSRYPENSGCGDYESRE